MGGWGGGGGVIFQNIIHLTSVSKSLHGYTIRGNMNPAQIASREKRPSVNWLFFAHALLTINTNCVLLTLVTRWVKHERVTST